MTVRRGPAALLLLLAALLGAAGCGGDDAPGGEVAPRADGSTLRGTWVDPDGDGALERGPGLPLRARTDLAPPTPPGRVLATLSQLTDTHVRDVESPARAAFLDRFGGVFAPTFRPHEALSAQVMAAGIAALDAHDPDALLVTGDVVDNAQANELDRALAVLGGGRVDPDSGAPGYRGVQRATNPDPSYYRPDVDPPARPGLLDRASRPFTAPGARAPWYAVPGNHDVLAAGEVVPTEATNAVAVGPEVLVRPDEDLEVPRDPARAQETVDTLLSAGVLPGETERVRPDPERRFLTPGQVRARLRAASALDGSPAGPAAPGTSAVVDVGARVRVVLVDLEQRGEGVGGVVTAAHEAFLDAALDGARERWVLVATHQPLRKAAGGERLLARMDGAPRMLAALAGDTHHHRVTARPGRAGGFWLVETAALADFPQQGRLLRVRETRGGGAVLESELVDTAPGPLADTARELAFLDAQGGRPGGNAGRRADGNVRLFRPAPR